MKERMVRQLSCDYCNKKGYQRPAMERHELCCTMNPNRVCKTCGLVGGIQKPIKDLISIMPSPTEEDANQCGEGCMFGDENTERINGAIEKLRDATDGCPACMLATLRQWGVCSNNSFDYKKEMKSLFDEINADKEWLC